MKDKGQKEQAPILQVAAEKVADLQNRFPRKSLLQLLSLILREGGELALKIAIEHIERNQGDKLTPEQWSRLQEFRAKLSAG